MIIPSKEEFIRRSAEGNLIPVYREILADRLTPVSAYEKIAGESGSFLLESVEGGEQVGRYSFLGSDPFLQFRSKNGVVWQTANGETLTYSLPEGRDALHNLQDLLESYKLVQMPGIPRFCGGAVGFLAYDMVRYFEELPDSVEDDLSVEDCWFLFTDTLLVFDHVKHRLKVICTARVDGDAEAAYDRAVDRIEDLVRRLRTPVLPLGTPPSEHAPKVRANMSQQQYERAVEICKEYIVAGDAFQVVPSLRFTVEMDACPFEVYRSLRSVNPSPHMYYVDFGEKQVVGTSPEILVTVDEGVVTVRPIAGTRPRGETPEEDQQLEKDLLADEKERAEHIMLVDLGRNDIGRVSEYGSVTVDELMVIERYSHVMHIVSNVTGRLTADQDIFDVTRACFPAGTLTGAPKVRAMQIIDEVEPTRRGLYGGAVGYYSFSGDMDFAIAIRTMLVQNGIAYVQAGAGVVADSVPENEYRECVNKARALMAAIEMAEAGLD
jgi:anthranilate synthase component 1